MSQSALLLQGGMILQHDIQDNVNVLYDTDLLIVGNQIEHIGKNITGPENCRLIDCHGKIICPGFVDTHHHMWQTQLKGRHSDDTLLDYSPKGNMQCFNYTPQDIFWGELAGNLEALDAGTTCVGDHAHMTYSPDHGLAGLSAAITAGIRSVFCYSIIPRFTRWDAEIEVDPSPISDWCIKQLENFTQRQPFGDGRVTIGFGFDMFHLPKDQVVDLYQTARRLGVKTITSHWRHNNIAGSGETIPHLLHNYSLLGPDLLLSHATGTTPTDLSLLTTARTHIASTPTTESQMAHGVPICFDPCATALASLGTDCHSSDSASMLHAMRVGLAVTRSHRNAQILDSGKFPRQVDPKTREALRLATVGGAKALGMQEEVGRLQVGMRADVLVVETGSPAMAAAVQEDPVVAVVRHAGTREVAMVVVDGVVRKEGGRLLGVEVEREVGAWDGREAVESVADAAGGKLGWEDILKQLVRSRSEIQRRIEKCDIEKARRIVLQRWGASDEDDVLG
ncbi:Metallo-dependent hydrolase [Viridothelium virens]|uniref:Metallo-dependent hydrolase n=1 Tax=Viridothelium virens TaxID=1048519 RepID=A0A6A6HC33_VIRVR|nr:Metallo-dependent hydrolase [Viridothelium virens]